MAVHFSSFGDIEHALGSGLDPVKRHTHTLDHMFELLDFLGNPQEKFKVVHVAGTSGKTSTAYYVAALLGAAGKRVGLTVSPHIYAMNERVQIDLAPLSEEEFCERFSEYWELLKSSRVVPNYFEACIAFAFWEFAARGVDYAVVEVGVGGLLDSTNVFTKPGKICVITDIGFDHMQILGNTLPEIAAQKAGIIQLHNPVFCYEQRDEVMRAVRSRAVQKQADLHTLTSSDLDKTYGFLPLFQQRNFGLALEVAKFITQRDGLSELTAKKILKAARTLVPARMEVHQYKDKTVIVDIAHNSQKFHALLESVADKYPEQPMAALIRMPARERSLPRVSASMHEAAKAVKHVIVTGLAEEGDKPDTSFDAEKLAELCRETGYESFEVVADPKEAFDVLCQRPEPVLLVTGSAYLVSHIADRLS